MEWFTDNWFFILVLVLFIALHLVGHGHGGHGGHGGDGGRGRPDQPPQAGHDDERRPADHAGHGEEKRSQDHTAHR